MLRPVQTGNVLRPNISKHWWPNMLMLKWVAKQLKHVWSNTDQTMDTGRWASVVCMRAPNNVWYGSPNEQNIVHQTQEKKKCFKLFDRMFDHLQIVSNTTKHDQTQSNSTKQGGQMVKCLIAKHLLIGQAFSDYYCLMNWNQS